MKGEEILNEIKQYTNPPRPAEHSEIFGRLVEQISPVSFRDLAGLDPSERLGQAEIVVSVVDEILKISRLNKWGLAKNGDFVFLYNGQFWKHIEPEALQSFLGEAAQKMGVPSHKAKFYIFREGLFKQFIASAYFANPEPEPGKTLINLKNGTLEISPDGFKLRNPRRADFLKYCLPFDYDPEAEAPIFQKYLDRVLPSVELQNILAEYLGYIFISQKTLKLDKVLICFGPGANGKSVLFEIVSQLLGAENVSSYSLQSLTDSTGYYRAMISNKLVNYASEISGNLEASLFKALASGESVEARLPYGRPFTLINYAKLIFNCNELPREVENTKAYFRRFLIVPFDAVIPENEQNPELARQICENELPGVLNWVLDGLTRLLKNKRFSDSPISREALSKYERDSNSVQMFLDENDWQPDPENRVLIRELYGLYRGFCLEDGFRPVNKSNFKRRLLSLGFDIQRFNDGWAVFARNVTNIPF